MKTLEIIQLRLAGQPNEDLCGQIRESIASAEGLSSKVAVFQREGLETDIAVHIHHEEKPDGESTRLGLQLVSELKSHGLIQHVFWKQVN